MTSIESWDPDAERDSLELMQPRLCVEFSELGMRGRFEAFLVERFGGESGFVIAGNVEFAHWPADEL